MSSLFYRLAVALVAIVAAMAVAVRADETYRDPYKDYDEFLFFDYDLDRNIETPEVGRRERKAVKEYMNRVKDRLKANYTLDFTRGGEVLIVTLPTDDLFLPNDTLLTRYGENRLKPLLPYLQDPMMFKVVYTVNTDDSGSPSYLSHLSEARSNTFYSWLLDKRVPDDLIIIPYPMAQDDPLMPNDSRSSRAINRRIEIYLIPGPKMIEMAHEGKLK